MNNEPLITISDLSHTFGEGEAARTVLNGVNVNFYPGEIVIVMGPSGAGKTTLLTLASALRSPQHGSVVVAGRELRGSTASQQLTTRRNIGFIFQNHNLLESLSARENTQMGLSHLPGISFEESRRRALEMLKLVGLAEHADKHPSKLSGGQRQRVAIARALVREPAIIMADEPTAALDSHSGREVVALLQKLARLQHCAILLVTHDNRILDIADRILTLEDGRIEESNKTLERIRTGLADAMRGIARYPALFSSGRTENAKDHARQTAELLSEWRQAAMTLASRKLNPILSRESAGLDKASEYLQQIEADALQFIKMIAATGEIGKMTTTDTMFQSLEFLLVSAAEAMSSGDMEELEQLSQLTADRGDMMETLRAKRRETLGTGIPEKQDAFFDLTDIFARTVYFLHELASCLLNANKKTDAKS